MINGARIVKFLWRLYTQLWLKRKFNAIGEKTVVFAPMQIDNPRSIRLGDKVFVARGCWLMGSPESRDVTLSIGEKTAVGHFAHIIGLFGVHIGASVLIADKVFITDCTHTYRSPEIPIVDQGVEPLRPVTIGDGAWLGENVCILGASVGKNAVIGANSVVVSDIPDYCVAVGSPARVVKRYDFEKACWEKVP